ncbi:MAG: hypothetical protein R3B93_06790 [Bacteroidia bacterium]
MIDSSEIADSPELSHAFEEVVAHHQAGDPMNASVRYTYLSRGELAQKLGEKGHHLSSYLVLTSSN